MSAASLTGAAAELELLFRATLLIGAAWAGAAALRRAGASASARHTAWLLGIAALLALPMLWWLAPALRLPVLAPESGAAILPAPTESPMSPSAQDDGDWAAVLFAAWAIGAVLLLLRIAIFRRMLARLWRDAEPARDAAWDDLLARVSREMRLSRPVELRIARGPAMPMTWGTLAPKLLLPAEAEAWPAERRRLVLLHELAHVARRDSLSRSAASLACALYWFHPGAWFAARQMRIEQEHAADDRVLNAGAPAHSYALSLVHLASGLGERSRFDPAAAMAGACQLERRLVSITTPARRELPGPAFLSSSVAMAACLTLVVAAGVPVRPAPTLSDPMWTDGDAFASDTVQTADRERREGDFNSPTPTAKRAPTLAAGDGGASVGRNDLRTAMGAAPPAPRDRRDSEDVRPPQEAPPQAREIVLSDGGSIGRPASQAAYGPTLPRAGDDAQDSDARIPELARRRGRGDSGNDRQPRDLGIRLVSNGPGMRPSPEISLAPGLALLLGQELP